MSLYMGFVTWPTHLSSHVIIHGISDVTYNEFRMSCTRALDDKATVSNDIIPQIFFIWRGDNFALQNVRFLSKLPLQNTWTAITWLSLHHLSVDYPRHPSSKGFTALHYYIEKSKPTLSMSSNNPQYFKIVVMLECILNDQMLFFLYNQMKLYFFVTRTVVQFRSYIYPNCTPHTLAKKDYRIAAT